MLHPPVEFALQKLRWLFEAPDRFKPKITTYAVTEEAARKMGELAERLNARGNTPQQTAHFLIQCVFCMFSEDAKLLSDKLFETVLNKSNPDGAKAQSRLAQLFEAMRVGGDFAMNDIPWFNGGLFKEIEVPALTTDDVVQLLDAARMDWGAIEPAILGTLFERGLNPDMRSQLGAHYTDPATILKLVRPVIEAPLLAEWQSVKDRIGMLLDKYVKGGKGSKTARDEAQTAFIQFIQRLKSYRVLDPACGSGNFLYLSLKALKDLEHRANLEAEALGLHRELTIETSPANVLGIELNPYAAELARVTVWIGEIQWMLTHGYALQRDPILRPLDHIENRDAILLAHYEGVVIEDSEKERDSMLVAAFEPEWPEADTIVGNPPFLGGSKKRGELGDEKFNALNRIYKNRVPGGADLVTYWFEKARAQIEAGKAQRAGLVATQSIRAGSNRKVLARILNTAPIFEAWSDEAWINNGAAVRVSLVCFGDGKQAVLDGKPVSTIHADLTAGGQQTSDVTRCVPLKENVNTVFLGTKKSGGFDIPGDLARSWLCQPNPHGRPNSEVVRPWANGQDLVGRPLDKWIIDFGLNMGEAEASLFEAPFKFVVNEIKPVREKNNRAVRAKYWWRLAETMPAMRRALANLSRYIATPRVSKHRVFVWRSVSVLADDRLAVIARDDDMIIGILSSRAHEVWALANASMHGVGNDPTYNAKSCFETFPFPEGLTPRDTPAGPQAAAIAAAAKKLNDLRETWLNPPEWVDWVRTPEEEQAGFPERPVSKPSHEADLKKRTLTNLYNSRPAWLDHAHRELDAAVAAAYGWPDYTPAMPDDEILKRLLAMNLDRASKQGATS